MMRPLPTDFAEYHRRRRWARAVTLVVGLLAAAMFRSMIVTASQPGDERRFAMVAYIGVVLILLIGGGAVVTVWKWSRRSRPVVQSLEPTLGEIYGLPELDEPPARHRGLSGEEPPPARW